MRPELAVYTESFIILEFVNILLICALKSVHIDFDRKWDIR